jgi:toxin CcdB
MARFDLYTEPGGFGFLLDVQTDLLQGFTTRIVIPVLPAESVPAPAGALTPTVDVEGRRYLLATQLLSAVPAAMLKAPVGNLSSHADAITRALDLLFQGF